MIIWKDIPGYNGRYKASDQGEILSINWRNTRGYMRKGKIMKQSHESNGYLHLNMVTENGSKLVLAHRLIAETFLAPVEGKIFVNHKNGIKHDNRVENLEWCTKSENSKHSFSIGIQDNKGVNHPSARFNNEQITEMREKHSNGISAYKISKEYKMSYTNAKDIVSRRTWSHI